MSATGGVSADGVYGQLWEYAIASSQLLQAGVDIITDGQVRWDDDQTYVMRHLGGVEIGSLERYLDTNTYYRRPEVTGSLAWREPCLAVHSVTSTT